jgi:hypothetical protein
MAVFFFLLPIIVLFIFIYTFGDSPSSSNSCSKNLDKKHFIYYNLFKDENGDN